MFGRLSLGSIEHLALVTALHAHRADACTIEGHLVVELLLAVAELVFARSHLALHASLTVLVDPDSD